MAANTIVRSAFAAGFPLLARAIFHNLGNGWASTLLGCIGVVLLCFLCIGKGIRGASRYAHQWKEIPNVISQHNVLLASAISSLEALYEAMANGQDNATSLFYVAKRSHTKMLEDERQDMQVTLTVTFLP
ncbi:hypothetical protein LIPSTDRAFT_337398, partial [Lipomyces starkeyi NRRL Y-11557]